MPLCCWSFRWIHYFRCPAGTRDQRSSLSRMCDRVRKRCPFAPLIFAILRLASDHLHHPREPFSLTKLLVFEAAAADDGKTEGEVLVSFRDTLRSSDGSPPGPLRSWGTTGPCNGNISSWYAVSCHGNGSVQGLQLEHLGLAGLAPDLGSLAVLPGLRVLSLSDNQLTGPFPNVSALGVLKMLYLSRNKFSGVIPDGTFRPMRGLRKLHLAENDFSGPVPGSITSPRLLEFVDVSHNNLSGPIPGGLSRFNATMFQGNEFLCGKPLPVACDPADLPAAAGGVGVSWLASVAASLMVLGVLLAVVGVATGVLGRRRRRRRRAAARSAGSEGDQTPSNPKLQTAPCVNISQAASTSAAAAPAAAPAAAKRGARRDEHGRLVFIQESRVRFEIEDLLRASAEVLGSGNFGSSYKATLLDGRSEVVVKRFKDMNGVGREDFSEHMRRLGRLAHPNLVPLVAYLYKKEEKLLITDYMTNGSLAQLLHGSKGSILDWGKRLRIIKGAARGVAHLYEELPMLTVPHGHLKSSNVLLDGDFTAVLSDYALVPVLTASHAAQVMVAYKSPECVAKGKPSKTSDVWSLGILALEVLTGRFPANYLRQGKQQGNADIAGWVSSVVNEERTGEVFDKDMAGTQGHEEEMLKLLRVALACCEADVDKRLDLKAALASIEEIKDPPPPEPGDSSTGAA
ncbi:pollen receptor-like kinase 4 [Brachypodium distachyon]|uniref:pollen receptor-like kinase 4 n=1 Tax=Brachypodium distachyon TaxID=15368 RepID=UPI000D0E237E|nr:pollen receptor-like kinase 4 [Brachypodium distachyon]|eukprot:XP_024316490.1 pollen receptor-like kinase 4 [Brachypodium distachyon]